MTEVSAPRINDLCRRAYWRGYLVGSAMAMLAMTSSLIVFRWIAS